MGVAEVGRRRREDVGEVREEEQGREAEEEELRAVHGAGAGGVDGFGLPPAVACWLAAFSKTRGGGAAEASRVALPGGLAESNRQRGPSRQWGSKGRASFGGGRCGWLLGRRSLALSSCR